MSNVQKFTIVTILLILSLILLFTWLSREVYERPELEIDLSTQNIHEIRCINEYGNLETYHINIPAEVMDVEAYAEGFCNSF